MRKESLYNSWKDGALKAFFSFAWMNKFIPLCMKTLMSTGNV